MYFPTFTMKMECQDDVRFLVLLVPSWCCLICILVFLLMDIHHIYFLNRSMQQNEDEKASWCASSSPIHVSACGMRILIVGYTM